MNRTDVPRIDLPFRTPVFPRLTAINPRSAVAAMRMPSVARICLSFDFSFSPAVFKRLVMGLAAR